VWGPRLYPGQPSEPPTATKEGQVQELLGLVEDLVRELWGAHYTNQVYGLVQALGSADPKESLQKVAEAVPAVAVSEVLQNLLEMEHEGPAGEHRPGLPCALLAVVEGFSNTRPSYGQM
jgi:hypothetical protein